MRKSYLKNVINSFRQAVPDAVGETMPGAKNIVSFVRDPTKGEDTGIRDIIAGYKKDLNDIKGIFGGIKKAFKTGKFYDRDEEEKAMMSAMGIDTSDFSFDEDDLFGDNEDKKSSKKGGSDDDLGFGDIGDDTESSSGGAKKGITNVNIFSDSGASEASSQLIAGAAMAGSAKTTSAIERGTAVSYVMTRDIDERLSRMEEASNKYYATSLELLGSIKSNLEGMAKGIAAKDTSLSPSQIERLFGDGDNEFNLRLYVKGLHEKFEDTFNLETLRMGKALFTPGGMLKMGMGAAMMKIPFMETIKKLTDMTEGIGQILLNQMANVKGNGPIAKLFRFFGVKTTANLNPGANKYEKGPVPFDGITRRSIVHIIPELLSDIRSILAKQGGFDEKTLNTLSKSNKTYDWENGKWSTISKLQNKNLQIIADMPMALQLAEGIVSGSTRQFKNNDEREEYKLKIATELINATNGKGFSEVLNSKNNSWLFRQIKKAMKDLTKSQQDAFAIAWDRERMNHTNSLRARERNAGSSDSDFYGIGADGGENFAQIEARDVTKFEVAQKWIRDNRQLLQQSGINPSSLEQKLRKFHDDQKKSRSGIGLVTHLSNIDYFRDFLEVEVKGTSAGDKLTQQLSGNSQIFNLDQFGAEIEGSVNRASNHENRLKAWIKNKGGMGALSQEEKDRVRKIYSGIKAKKDTLTPFEQQLTVALNHALEYNNDFTDDELSSSIVKNALHFLNHGIQTSADKGEAVWRTLRELGTSLPTSVKNTILPWITECFPNDPEVQNAFIKWASETSEKALKSAKDDAAKDKFIQAYRTTGSARQAFISRMQANNIVEGEHVPVDENGNPTGKYATGGYTGAGDKYQVAGIVHKNEYVVPSEIVASPQGRSLVGKLEAMRLGYAEGGFASLRSLTDEQLGALVELTNVYKRNGARKYSIADATKMAREGNYNYSAGMSAKGKALRRSLDNINYTGLKDAIKDANGASFVDELLVQAKENVWTPMSKLMLGEKVKINGNEVDLKGVKADLRDALPAMGKGAGIGAAASFFLPGGPLLGAFAGGVIGAAKQNERFRQFLFGKKGKDGEIEKQGVLSKVSDSLVTAIFGKQAGDKFKENKASFFKNPLLYMKGLYVNNKATVAGAVSGGLLGTIFGPTGSLVGGLLGAGAGKNIGKNGFLGKIIFGKRYVDENGNVKGYSGGLYQMAAGAFNAGIAGPLNVLFFGNSRADMRDPKTGNYDPRRVQEAFKKNMLKFGKNIGVGGILGGLVTGGNPIGALVGSAIGAAFGMRNTLPGKAIRVLLFGRKNPDAKFWKHGIIGGIFHYGKLLVSKIFKGFKWVGGKFWGFLKKTFPALTGVLGKIGQGGKWLGGKVLGLGKIAAKTPFAAVRGTLTSFYGGTKYKVLSGEDFRTAVYKDPNASWADKGVANIEVNVKKLVDLVAKNKMNKTDSEKRATDLQALEEKEKARKRGIELNEAKAKSLDSDISKATSAYEELKKNPLADSDDIRAAYEKMTGLQKERETLTGQMAEAKAPNAVDDALLKWHRDQERFVNKMATEKRLNSEYGKYVKNTPVGSAMMSKEEFITGFRDKMANIWTSRHSAFNEEAAASNGHAVGGLVTGLGKGGRALKQFLSRFRGSAAALLRDNGAKGSSLLAPVNGEYALDSATQGAIANTRAQMVAAQVGGSNSALGDLLKVGTGILSIMPGGAAVLGGLAFASPIARLAKGTIKGIAKVGAAAAKVGLKGADLVSRGAASRGLYGAKFALQYKGEQAKELLGRGMSFIKNKIGSAGSALKNALSKLKPIELVKKFAGYLGKFLKTAGSKFLKYAKAAPKVGPIFAAIDAVLRYNANTDDGQSKRQKIRMIVLTGFEVIIDCIIMFIMASCSVLSGGVAAAVYICIEILLKYLTGKDIAEWIVTPLRRMGVTDWIGDVIADIVGCPKDDQVKEPPDPDKMADTLGQDGGFSGTRPSGGDTEGQSDGSSTYDVSKHYGGFFGAIKSAFTESPRLEDYVVSNGHNLEGLKPGFKHNLAFAAKEYYETFGEKLRVNSAFRTTAKQQELFRDYLVDRANGRPNTGAAAPGRSNHQTGLAIDIDSQQVNRLFGLPDELGYKKTPAPGSIGEKYGLARLDNTTEKENGRYKESWHVTPSDEKIYRAATEEIRNLPENVEATKKAFEAANKMIGGGKGFDYNDFAAGGKSNLSLKSVPSDPGQVGDGGDHSTDMLPAVAKMIELLQQVAASMMSMNGLMNSVVSATQATAANTERPNVGVMAAIGAL